MTKDDLLIVLLVAPFAFALYDFETTVWCVHMSTIYVVGGCVVGVIAYFICRLVSRAMGFPSIFCAGTATALIFIVALLVTDHFGLFSEYTGTMLVILAMLPGALLVRDLDLSYEAYLEKKDRERRLKSWRG